MTYVIAEPCVDVLDKACIDECPVDCIYEGERMLYIHPDECVDCGACEPVCPVEAIYYEDDVPGRVGRLHQGQRRLLRRAGFARRGREGRQGRARPAVDQGLAAAGRMSGPKLPDFPWDSLAGHAATARAHPGGIVDLSVGTPVDPVPDGYPRRARRRCPTIPGYPATHGTPELRDDRCRGAAPALRRHRCGARRGTAHDRLEGAGGVAADAARCSVRATSSSSPSWRTRPTRWARCWRAHA